MLELPVWLQHIQQVLGLQILLEVKADYVLKVEVVSVVGQGVLEEQLGGEGVASWALRSGKNLSGLLAECQLENSGNSGALKFLRVLGWV